MTETHAEEFGAHIGHFCDLGTFVVGGELAYVSGDYDDFPTNNWTSTRLKLIGGYDAGRVLPYGFVGLPHHDVSGASEFSDTVSIHGVGAKFAVTNNLHAGLEYLVENKDDFDGGPDLENSELSLRMDYRF